MVEGTEQKKAGGQRIMELPAKVRSGRGRRSCRKLRKEDWVPANLYGHGEQNDVIAVAEEQFMKYFTQGHRIMHLNFDNKQETGMVKEVQYAPLGEEIIHIDFVRVSLREDVHMQVPIVPVGVPKGVTGGGTFDHVRKELEVEGPAVEIPEEIELNVSEMVIGDVIRVNDVPLPEGCKVLHAAGDDAVVAIHAPRRVEKEEEEEAAPEGEEPAVEGEEGGKGSEKEEDQKGGKE